MTDAQPLRRLGRGWPLQCRSLPSQTDTRGTTMVDPTVQSPIGAHSLPPAIHILAAFGLAAGLVFWSLGWKLRKPAFAFLGGIAGGFVGFFLFPTFAPAM